MESQTRRHFLRSSIVTATVLAGCSNNNSTNDSAEINGNEQENLEKTDTSTNSEQSGQHCIPKPNAAAVAGESISFDGVTAQIGKNVNTKDYVGYDEESISDGRIGVLIPIDFTVTGENAVQFTPRGLEWSRSVAYYGSTEAVTTPASSTETVGVDGETYELWDEKTSVQVYPEESVSGALFVSLPEDYDAGAVTFPIAPRGDMTSQIVSLGDQTGIEYPCVSTTVPQETIGFGTKVQAQGIECTVEDYILAPKLTGEGSAEPNKENRQVLVVTISYENILDIRPTKLPPVPTVKYADTKPLPAGSIQRDFQANGKSFIGIRAEGDTLDPSESLTGAIAFMVPTSFDASKLRVMQSFGSETVSYKPV